MSGSKWAMRSASLAAFASASALGLQAAEHARAALGGLGEQDAVARSLVGRQQLAVELGVLQLEGRLDASLKRVHDGQGGVDHDGAGELEDEDVAAVAHVRDDPRALPGRGVVVVAVLPCWPSGWAACRAVSQAPVTGSSQKPSASPSGRRTGPRLIRWTSAESP